MAADSSTVRYGTCPPSVVLDTNVVLDWLLFEDRLAAPLAAAIMTGRIRWLATKSMRDELRLVLERGLATRRAVVPSALLAIWDAHATMRPDACAQPVRCADPDDQKFVDLGLATNARWLVSRDLALLRLARRTAPMGLQIVVPSLWMETR